jgi:hypothetical protein
MLFKVYPAHKINILLALAQLMIFGIIGKFLLHNNTSWTNLAICISTSVLIEHIFLYLVYKKLSYISISSINTPFSTALMLASTNSLMYVPILILAIGQKYILKIRGKHFQNPSNLVIFIAMLFFSNYFSINFMSFGIYWWLIIPLSCIGIYITYKVHILHMIPAFVLAFFTIFTVLTGMTFAQVMPFVFSLNFLLFTFYMQTDPKTVPSTATFQIIHSFCTVIMIALFYNTTHTTQLMFYGGLFFAQLFVPLWRYLEEKTSVDSWVRGFICS